jgi:hypothetical protein
MCLDASVLLRKEITSVCVSLLFGAPIFGKKTRVYRNPG